MSEENPETPKNKTSYVGNIMIVVIALIIIFWLVVLVQRFLNPGSVENNNTANPPPQTTQLDEKNPQTQPAQVDKLTQTQPVPNSLNLLTHHQQNQPAAYAEEALGVAWSKLHRLLAVNRYSGQLAGQISDISPETLTTNTTQTPLSQPDSQQVIASPPVITPKQVLQQYTLWSIQALPLQDVTLQQEHIINVVQQLLPPASPQIKASVAKPLIAQTQQTRLLTERMTWLDIGVELQALETQRHDIVENLAELFEVEGPSLPLHMRHTE